MYVITINIESTNQRWMKLAPPFLNTKFYGARLCDYVQQTTLPAQFACYLRISICRISNPRFIEIGSASLLIQPYKVLLSVKIFYAAVVFSNFSTFIFIAHFATACVNPRILFSCRFSFYVSHLFVNNSLIPSLISATKLAPTFLLCILCKSSNLQDYKYINVLERNFYATGQKLP